MAGKNIGVAPGTLVYTGKETGLKTSISLIIYDVDRFNVLSIDTPESIKDTIDLSTKNWINIVGLNDEKIIEKTGDFFAVNRLLLEDVLNVNQLPKLDDFSEHIFVTLKMIRLMDDNFTIEEEHISFILGKNFLISFQEKEGDVFEPVRIRLQSQSGRIRTREADYLLYALLDAIIDNYLVVTKSLEERIEKLETDVFENESTEVPKKIIALRSELNTLKKYLQPCTILTQQLLKTESKLISGDIKQFLADLNDHSNRALNRITEQRETLSSYMDLHLSLQGQKMNEIMKVLTIVAAIFIPLTFLAGIYGMNFSYMPELGFQWSYPILLTTMLIIGVGLILYFKKKKWL